MWSASILPPRFPHQTQVQLSLLKIASLHNLYSTEFLIIKFNGVIPPFQFQCFSLRVDKPCFFLVSTDLLLPRREAARFFVHSGVLGWGFPNLINLIFSRYSKVLGGSFLPLFANPIFRLVSSECDFLRYCFITVHDKIHRPICFVSLPSFIKLFYGYHFIVGLDHLIVLYPDPFG